MRVTADPARLQQDAADQTGGWRSRLSTVSLPADTDGGP